MVLSEIFEHLNYGELSQLSIGTANDGAIAVADYPKIISYLNMALLVLHTRFPLIEKQLIVQQYDHITKYNMEYKYALTSGSSETYKYITDSITNPFLDDVLSIEEVFNELGEALPLNDSAEDTSLYTPQPKVLQIPQPVSTNATIVLYRARHPTIIATGVDPDIEEVELPYQLLEACLFYIAYRAQSGIAAGSKTEISFLTKFENAVAQVIRDGLIHPENNTNTRSEINGWV
jgi:hypothetical protein